MFGNQAIGVLPSFFKGGQGLCICRVAQCHTDVAQKAATMTQTSFTSIGASKGVLGKLSAWQIPRRLPRTFREAQMPSVKNQAWTYVSQGHIAGAATTTTAASGGPRHPSTQRRCETF